MQYANPNHFPLIFFAVAALVLFYIWAAARRRRLVERFAEKNLIASIAPSASAQRRVMKTIMIASAVF